MGGGGPDTGAKTGGRDRDSECGNMESTGWMEGGGVTDICLSEVWNQVSRGRGTSEVRGNRF